MPLLKIQSYPGIREIFIASDTISDLATVELVVGPGRRVAMGSTTRQELAAGVARGAVVSGAIVRVVTHGIVSGVKVDQDVNAGDRLSIATSGMVTPFNTITPAGLVSGNITGGISGHIYGVLSGEVTGGISGHVYGLVSGGVSGAISGYVPINLASGGGLSGMIGVMEGPALAVMSGGSLSGVTGAQFASGAFAGAIQSGLVDISLSSGSFAGEFNSGLIDVSLSSGVLAAEFGSGLLVGTAFNTGRVVGKALTSGLSGLGIQMMVSLG